MRRFRIILIRIINYDWQASFKNEFKTYSVEFKPLSKDLSKRLLNSTVQKQHEEIVQCIVYKCSKYKMSFTKVQQWLLYSVKA